jgi:hypothetical protein
MDDISERIRYGFRLWPFPALIMVGVFINSFGTGLYQSVLSGLGLPFVQVLLIIGVLLIQLAAGVIAGAGFFGGLYKVLEDVRE